MAVLTALCYLGWGHGWELWHGGDLQGLQGGAAGGYLRALRWEWWQEAGGWWQRAHGLAAEHLLQGSCLRDGLLLQRQEGKGYCFCAEKEPDGWPHSLLLPSLLSGQIWHLEYRITGSLRLENTSKITESSH